jgi:hypothetical protein
MALGQATHTSRTITRWDLIRALVVVAAVLIAIVALLGAFGLPQMAPSYDIVPDPAGPLGF